MRSVLQKDVIYIVLLAFACYVLPVNIYAKDTLESGKATADEAASLQLQEISPPESISSLRSAISMTGGYADTDSTEFEFPEEKKSHLARDITVFVIASVFVAYFLIKVFLEGDKDEEEQDDGGSGKPPPPV